MKEIWDKFTEACAKAWGDCWAGIKACLKSTLELLKTTCVEFVTGVFAWIKEVAIGLGKVVWSLVEVVVAAFVAMLKAIFELVFGKIIAWIKKW